MPAALNLLDRAVALITDQDPVRLELTHQLGNALWSVGEVARAESLMKGLIDAASASGDRRIAWYARLDVSGQRRMRERLSFDELLITARDALAVFDDLGDDLGLARASYQLAVTSRMAGRFGESAETAKRALECARRSGNRQIEARTVDALCTALLYGPTPVPVALRRCRALLSSAAGSQLREANVRSALGGLEAMAGSFGPAREHCSRARATYEDLGLRFAIAGLTQIEGAVELLAGNVGAAERALREGLAILEPVGAHGLQAAMLANVLLVAGRSEEARRFADVALRAADPHVMSQVLRRSVWAQLEAESRPAHALRLAREAVAVAEKTDALPLHADATEALAQVLAAVGETDEATSTARAALHLHERKGNLVSAERATALLAERVRST
jgi:tetratricopeptide (TPR) repeat protein